jgi:hypothetical protein
VKSKRVFVLNDGGQDYTPAKEYGELIFCTEGELNKFDISAMYRQLNNFLDGSDCDDYIVLTSLSSLCSVACAIMAAMHGEVHLLIYDVKTRRYVSRDLML